MTISVLLVGDSSLLLRGLRAVLEGQTEVNIIAECANPTDTIAQLNAIRPNVVMLAYSSPGDVMQACLLVRQQNSECRILAICTSSAALIVNRILAAGAHGYLLQNAAPDMLLQATTAMANGKRFIDPQLKLLPAVSDAAELPPPVLAINSCKLSAREEEVLRLIAMGYANKEIGAYLKLSTKTIETYKTRSLEKLSMQGRAEIVQYAVEQQWLTEDAYRQHKPMLHAPLHDGQLRDEQLQGATSAG